MIPQRLFICGVDEIGGYQSRRLTHWVSIANPAAAASRPSWFKGARLQLSFGDVASEADAAQCKARAPNIEDVRRGIEFFREAWRTNDSKVLVSCAYGASRSPALAYVFIADQLGAGRETEAFRMILSLRPNAVPNGLVVQVGDALLKRHGALLQPLQELYKKINAELSR